jgi:hypothetical protein
MHSLNFFSLFFSLTNEPTSHSNVPHLGPNYKPFVLNCIIHCMVPTKS